MRRYHFRWWMRFNYILSAGLDSGVAIAVLVIFVTMIYPKGEINLKWWGTTSGRILQTQTGFHIASSSPEKRLVRQPDHGTKFVVCIPFQLRSHLVSCIIRPLTKSSTTFFPVPLTFHDDYLSSFADQNTIAIVVTLWLSMEVFNTTSKTDRRIMTRCDGQVFASTPRVVLCFRRSHIAAETRGKRQGVERHKQTVFGDKWLHI